MKEDRIPVGFGHLSASVGDHIGHFYETPKERNNILVSFLTTGLEAGDRCVCIISPGARPELERGLADTGAQVEAVQASGQLLIHEGADDPGEMKALLADTLSEIPGRYPLLRWVGDMTWSLGKMPTTEKLMEWESHCNIVEDPLAVFLCQYDLTAFRGNVVMDALKTHPTCVVGGVIHRNPYYEEPEAFLQELHRKPAASLAH